MSTVAIDRVAAPIDHLRTRVLRATGPVGRRLVADRELRVATNATVGIAVATATSTLLPLWMLIVGPLLFGVAHLAADLRYLVVRPGLHRQGALVVAAGAPIVAYGLGAPVAVGLAAVVGAAIATPGTAARRVGVGVVGAALVAIGVAAPFWTQLALSHAHNLVGIGVWWLWRGRAHPWHLVPVALFTLVFTAILGGAFDGAAVAEPAATPAPLVAAWLAPRIPDPWATRLVISFAFAQQVHYSVWLRLVPDDARARVTSRNLRRTLRDTVDDLGWPLVIGAIALGVGLIGWASIAMVPARDAYLHLARFHGVLELAALAVWGVAGRPRPA